jgi:hypothetical protein
VNDTGAIAYFSERRTFDVVGLTTKGEGRFWLAGAGSRLEHYERMAKTTPAALPTYFIVYPEWMGCDAVLGEPLQEATVTDATILGGQTMRAYVADYTLLGSGDLPWSRGGHVLDELDVADLESEASHAYLLLDATENEEIARDAIAPDGRRIVDGGRTRRTRDTFVMDLAPGALVARLEAREPVHFYILVDGDARADATIDADSWCEIAVPITHARGKARVELIADDPITTYHYWLIE